MRLWRQPGLAWCLLAALHGAAAAVALLVPAPWVDWQPSLVWAQPWRAFSAAWVHWTDAHLLGNLAATAVLAAYGWTARAPLAATGAWLLAWPLAHLALLLKPELAHYGGLSGLLHAGVAVVSLHLVLGGRGATDEHGAQRVQRWVGGAVLAGLALKVLSEKPWGAALQRSADWDMAVAPLAHASGAVAGLVCAALGLALCRAWR